MSNCDVIIMEAIIVIKLIKLSAILRRETCKYASKSGLPSWNSSVPPTHALPVVQWQRTHLGWHQALVSFKRLKFKWDSYLSWRTLWEVSLSAWDAANWKAPWEAWWKQQRLRWDDNFLFGARILFHQRSKHLCLAATPCRGLPTQDAGTLHHLTH